jgi:hypothetical protein
MASQSDFFGYAPPAQGNLFGPGENRMQPPQQSTLPDPEKIRRRLKRVLQKARNASTMPWSEREAQMWLTVFPNMAKWLPDAEAEQLRLEFLQEMKRLAEAA